MFSRPKPGENEDDILRMQEEFLQQKNKDPNLQPAARVINLSRIHRRKRFNTSRRSLDTVPGTRKQENEYPSQCRKPSKYAQSKGLTNHEKKQHSNSLIGDVLEKNIQPECNKMKQEDDKVYFPTVIPSILGGIIERKIVDHPDCSFSMPAKGFPEVTKRGSKIQLSKTTAAVKMDVDEACTSKSSEASSNLSIPSKSYIVSSSDADEIHKENINLLRKMSASEILEEQQKLMSNMDPKVIEFLKSKRKITTTDRKQAKIETPTEAIEEQINVKMNTDSEQTDPHTLEDELWENDVLSHSNINNWLHFDKLEKDKLEWMKGITESKKVTPDEPYEARFNFKGYLLPYTIEYTEETKTLFHHGDEPHRPGYSLSELLELTRSSINQQKAMALNTIAGILEYASAGTYKDVVEIPYSKIFFIIRIAIDDNKTNVLEPALKAMRNLLYNRIDEASLDALIGFEKGTQQPCLENDKSEIEELESNESDLKDFHLAEIDIISAAIRTDLLQRIYYILYSVRPSFNCVHYCMQILTRLARDSVDTCEKIVQTEHLMRTIIDNFIPATTVNFHFDPQIAYNRKPVLAALKFMRVLSLQSKEISTILVKKYEIMKPISEYISSGVDGTYGLKLQIEAFCIFSNLLAFRSNTDMIGSMAPLIVTALFKHVQGTDILMNSSMLSATHAAVVMQCINRILICNLPNMDSYKHQIYPLLKEGTQKWIYQLSNSDNYTCGHLRLLCSALNCCKSILLIERVPIKFLSDSLKTLSKSKGYKALINNLCKSSNLLSKIKKKELYFVKNLMTLGVSVIDSTQKLLPVLNISSPIPLLASLFDVLYFFDEPEITAVFIEPLADYLNRIATQESSLCENWFTRMETDFIIRVITVAIKCYLVESNKDLLYTLASKLCYILRADKKVELQFLFNEIVFNKYWFTTERLMSMLSVSEGDAFPKVQSSMDLFNMCYSRVPNFRNSSTGPNVVLKNWQEPILPRDWIYLPILRLYSLVLDQVTDEPKLGRIESATLQLEKQSVITCSLEWIILNEICFPELLNDIDVTDRFCRILCIFLCDNSMFLEDKIKFLLQKCVEILFKKEKKTGFDFDKQLMGLNNFQDFYTQCLEQFQSVSYGDHTFAACVLAPLSQRHNVKWRKLLWSEYAGCLRALDCPEDRLCYEMKDYLYPEETDESLIKSYFQALNSNLLRPNTIAHRIAEHHTNSFKIKNQ